MVVKRLLEQEYFEFPPRSTNKSYCGEVNRAGIKPLAAYFFPVVGKGSLGVDFSSGFLRGLPVLNTLHELVSLPVFVRL